MKPKYFFSLILSFLIFNCSLLIGTVRYVSTTGSSTPPYTSWETAADSIQKCINICSFGDTVYVANGVYKEQVVMIPGLSLIGGGMDSCLINFQTTGVPAVEVVESCVLKGFKIVVPNTLNTWGIRTNGNSGLITLNKIVNASLGIYVDDSNITIYKNILENIKTYGIWIFNSNSVIRQNVIYTDPNSQSGSIAGIRLEAFNNSYSPTVDSNYIEVTKFYGIYKSFGTSPIIYNNTIKLKGLGAIGILMGYDSIFCKNNLILAEIGSRGIDHRGYSSEIANTYVSGNFSDFGLHVGSTNFVENNSIINGKLKGVEVWNTSGLVFHYNNVWNNAVNYSGFIPDSTNISVDPMVVNDDVTRGELDFHLQKYSPLIDAGDPNILDKDGSRSDIGLYGGLYGESYKYLDLAPRAPINLTALADTNYITLNWNKNTEADTAYYKVYRDTVSGFQIDSTKLISSTTDTFFIQVNPHNVTRFVYKVTCVDKQGNESKPSEELIVNITSVSMNGYPMTISDYILYQNYPNPFNPSTRIGYKLKEGGYVKLMVYDIKGELVSVLVNKEQNAGYYEVEFNVGNGLPSVPDIPGLASGVYIYQIIVKSENNIPVFSDIKKMLYLK
ncbi:MAG TPA: hypothetical protein PK073_04500 [Ignavibacteriaceae bacterium]|jgi:hypothetical protein|nr:hypothetical protein [Ignavibacteriaceae bacterium]